MPINSLADLQAHLRTAIEVEHSTIPPYLCALYSIQDRNSDAANIIRSVVVQEMLHMALACNMLNAVGGTVNLADPTFIPTYPGPLPGHAPHPPLNISLQACSIDLVYGTFMEIEKPETVEDPPEADNYTTIGQFYAAVALGLQTLGPDIYTKDPTKQVTTIYYPPSGVGGKLFAVTDYQSATDAITEIVDEGEGSPQSEYDDSSGKELAHYWKFNQIVDQTIPLGAVYPMAADPQTAKLAPPLQDLSQLFNDCYCLLLRALTQIFNTGDSTPLLGPMYTLMNNIIEPLAVVLMQQPLPNSSETAGPSFEYSTTPQATIVSNCRSLAQAYPQLNAAPPPGFPSGTPSICDSLAKLPAIDPTHTADAGAPPT